MLGGPLFFREANRLQLTALGRQMQPMLQQVLDGAAAAQRTAEGLRLLHQAPIRWA